MNGTQEKTMLERITSGAIVCEIINPSDPYTLRCDDFMVAAVAILILGRGKMGLKELGGEERQSPVLFGWEEWLESFGVSLDEYVPLHYEQMAAIFDTVLIGSDRKQAEDTAAIIQPDKLEDWLLGRHDSERSSLSDIGGAARQYAEFWRENAEEAAE